MFYITVKIGITLISAYVGSTIIRSLLKTVFIKVKNQTNKSSQIQRVDTLESISKNTISITIFIIALLASFTYAGFNITPILTGVGILGLAISFGAQTLVKDLISGFFILLENQFNVGDSIKIDALEGVVHKITFRTTILKDKDNNFIYIPNANIQKVIVKKK